jgi:hypothetical protein
VAGVRFVPRVLRDTTPRQLALYRGTICLVLRRGPRDFHNGAKLTGDLIIEHGVDDHHVFPHAYLDRQGMVPRFRDCMLNRTLIDRTTNRRITDRAPADYMAQIRQAFIMGCALIGVAQEANVTGVVDDQPVVDRVALLLTAVMVLVFLWIFRARERPLRTIRPNRGYVGTTFVRSVVSQAAQSSAVRAGSSS